MTKEELQNLSKIKKEIDLLEKQIEKIEPEYTKDSVKGSMSEFPYTQSSFKISGYALEEHNERIKRICNKIKKKQNELIEESERVLEFIYTIKDSEIRQIIIHKYIDGLTLSEIAEKIGCSEITIKLKHSIFLKSI